MTPWAIVDAALARGLDLIAVTDHNTAAMTPVIAAVARSHGLAFLYGIELQTREDVHLLAYFDDEATCLAFSDEIYALLPDTDQDPYGLGDQTLVDAEGAVLRIEKRFLVNGIDLSFADAVHWITAQGGLAVPAHIDREFFGLMSQLGAVPEGIEFSIFEVRYEAIPDICGAAAVLRTSDAHFLDDIGARTSTITVEDLSIAELRLAATGVGGRSIVSEVESPIN
jgi:predicted metal-dependent phosphoesterase TrpH